MRLDKRKVKKLKWLASRLIVAILVSWLVTTIWLLAQRQYRQTTGSADLVAVLEDTAATDPDWTWDRLNAARDKPPVGKNGADVVRQAREKLPPEWMRGFEPVQWEPAAPDIPPNFRYPTAVINDARAKLAPAQAAVGLARRLKDCPTGHRDLALKPDVWSTLLPDTAQTPTIARLLRWDTVLAAEDSDPRLIGNLHALLNASRSIGDEPFLISQVIRVATRAIAIQSTERALAQSPLAPPDLAALQTAWVAEAEEPLLLYGLRGDRAAVDVLFRNLADGTVGPGELSGPKSERPLFDRFAGWLERGRIPGDRAFYLWWTAHAVAVARLPMHEQLRAVELLPPVPATDRSIRYSLLFLPAAEKVTRATVHSTAEACCAVAGLACERFRQARARWPEALTELVPEFLSAVPLDPFSGEPLRFVKLEHGAVVYSVGPDGTDAGGTLEQLNTPPATHARFRLWNPDQRRLPSPQPPAQEHLP